MVEKTPILCEEGKCQQEAVSIVDNPYTPS
jgi:hypothetical protein